MPRPQNGLTGVPRYGWDVQGKITVSLRAAAAGTANQTQTPSCAVPATRYFSGPLPSSSASCSSFPVSPARSFVCLCVYKRQVSSSRTQPTREETLSVYGPPTGTYGNEYLPSNYLLKLAPSILRSLDAPTPFSYQIVLPRIPSSFSLHCGPASLLYRLDSQAEPPDVTAIN